MLRRGPRKAAGDLEPPPIQDFPTGSTLRPTLRSRQLPETEMVPLLAPEAEPPEPPVEDSRPKIDEFWGSRDPRSPFAPPRPEFDSPATPASGADVPVTEIDDRTRAVTRVKQGFALAGADGTRIDVEQPTLVGRAPDQRAAPDAVVVAIVDPIRSVSKTHALLRLQHGSLTIEDLDSTNGVQVVRDDAQVDLPAHEAHVIRPGDRVVLGELEFRVESAA